MLLTGAGSTRSPAARGQPKRGDPLALHFSLPSSTGIRHFRVQAKIARILDNGRGVGVMFDDGLPANMFQALLDFAGASGLATPTPTLTDAPGSQPQNAAAPQPAVPQAAAPGVAEPAENIPTATDAEVGIPLSLLKEGGLGASVVAQLRPQVHALVKELLQTIGSQFLDVAFREFLLSARDAGNNRMHQRYLETLDLLERHGNAIVQYFVTSVLADIDTVRPLDEVLERRRRRETGGGRELSLVDAEQFEDWLAVADLVSKAETQFGDTLLDLRARFGLMARPWAHKEALPVGPGAVAWAFADAIKEADVQREVRPDFYRYFEQVLLRNLGGLYDQLVSTLEGSGHFPPTSRLREALQWRPAPRPPGAPQVQAERYQQLDGAVREAIMAADGFGGGAAAFQNPYRPTGSRLHSAYRAVRSLSELGRARMQPGSSGASPLSSEGGGDARQLTRQELLEALAELEHENGDVPPEGVRLKPRLLEVLAQRHGSASRLEPEDLDNLTVMETLVDSLESDRYLTESARSWIRRLELTLNKLATTDRGFLERAPDERPHSATTLLNQLARLGGDQRDGADRDTVRRVEELLERVTREFDKNPAVIEDVVDELDPLVDKQARTYRTNLERTVRASEGRQKLVRARRAVLAVMNDRLAGREVPELLLQLVNPGWRNLLVHTHLRRGVDSPEWLDQLEVFDKLHGLLDRVIEPGSPGYVEPEVLLKRVVQGLNSITFDPAKRTPLLMALSATLIGDSAGVREPVRYRHVPDAGVAAALGLEGIETAEEPEPPSDSEAVRRNWAAALARVRRIEVGEWLATTDPEGRPVMLSVAFLGDDLGSFVLVNRKGVKVRECSLAELAEDICQGRVTPLDDFDLPLMERASQRMLENMHSRLAFQAAHDELTTLLNRREFERLVETAVQKARTRNQIHALLYIDLDQFKIINNTSGHTAGDELLKRIAGWLSGTFAGEKVQVARLGGDEFGILAEAVTPAEARDLADRVLKLFRESGFEWEGRTYNLSVTIGLVLIDRTMESVDHAMQFADEACYAAKDAGRNRVQEYRSADTVIQARHGFMESVTQLDKALADDRLILNCQRIAPLDPARGQQQHFEILLTMEDASGQVIPPREFILAAETYQRMAAVDRWVIGSVLRWMAEHRERLDAFGGFAVNVSGDSMNDETFPDFVLQQFELTGAPTGKVCFEITETAAIANLENAREFMNRMKIIGCSFSLDDFGTGHSSYSYLRNLPVDFVKIDGVFVKGLAESQDDYAVVRSINEIGHYLGKETIAECVESPVIMDRIGEIGLDYAQGYFVGMPVRLDELKLP